jgi:hypothetical protein
MIEGTYDYIAKEERLSDTTLQQALEAHLERLAQKINTEIAGLFSCLN